MYAEQKGNYRIKGCYAALLLLFVTIADVSGENLLAVMDLECDGSVSQQEIITISNKISASLVTEPAYIQFDRTLLPELLKQLSIDQSATVCSDAQCLIIIGSLIGANTMIGGSIRKKNKETEIKLKLVDVIGKKAINSVTLSSRSSQNKLLEKEVPALTESLMSDDGENLVQNTDSKKSFFRNPLTYIGPVLLAGAAAGAYYYKYNYKNDHESDPGASGISLDDTPERTRRE